MAAPRDKLGEFVLFAEGFNRYEEFAASPECYAILDQARPTTALPGGVDLYVEQGNPSADERRVLVHSDRVYGRGRPATFVFDLRHEDDVFPDWVYDSSPGALASGADDKQYHLIARLRVRAVTTDFDPTAVTWDSAYGGAPLGFSAHRVEALLGQHRFGVHVEDPTPYDPDKMLDLRVWTGNDIVESLPNVIVRGAGEGWNDLDEIHGFELSLTLEGGLHTPWEGPLPLDEHWARYIANMDEALCYAIRA